MTQHLSVADVKAKAREFYEAGKLTAQHPIPVMRQCVYETSDGYRCAVGAAMSSETLQALREAGAMSKGITNINLYAGAGITAEPGVEDIQFAHDEWARVAARSGDMERIEDMKGRFTRTIGLAA